MEERWRGRRGGGEGEVDRKGREVEGEGERKGEVEGRESDMYNSD